MDQPRKELIALEARPPQLILGSIPPTTCVGTINAKAKLVPKESIVRDFKPETLRVSKSPNPKLDH